MIKANFDLQFPVSNRYDANENNPDSFLTPAVSGVAFIRILIAIKGKLEPASFYLRQPQIFFDEQLVLLPIYF